MASTRTRMLITLLQLLILISRRPSTLGASSALFREYIGAEFKGVKFSDVPINPGVEFHFILSFAIDYTADGSSSTDGNFNVFWDMYNLSPAQVTAIKQSKSNVRVALSLGGNSVGNSLAYFNPSTIDSWVSNAVSSLTRIIQEYDLDGIDVDYEHFSAEPDTFAECIGRLVTWLVEQVRKYHRLCQLPVLRLRFEHDGVSVFELLRDAVLQLSWREVACELHHRLKRQRSDSKQWLLQRVHNSQDARKTAGYFCMVCR